MQCPNCHHDVYPVRTMSASDGAIGGFVNRCPRAECGMPMPAPAQKVVSLNLDDEIAVLQSELSALEQLKDLSDEDKSSLKETRSRLHSLLKRKSQLFATPVAPAPAPQPVALPLTTFTVGRAPEAPLPFSTPSRNPGNDIFAALHSRLIEIKAEASKLDAEARKIEAVLAVANTVQ